MADPAHVKVWNIWRGRAGMLLTASWVRIAAVIIAAAAVLELLFAIWHRWGRSASTELIITVGLALASPLAYGIWWLWWRMPKRQVDRLALPTTKESADVEDNFRKTVGQLIGGAAVLIGAAIGTAFGFYQFSLQQKSAQNLLISNQVSKGFEQLAGEKIEMRLGGIYALEGVMNTSEQYHEPVLEALCAFVRESTIGKTASKDKPATDVQAALTVIGRRIKGPGEINLANVSIPGANLFKADLSDADLTKADLTKADLSDAILLLANLSDANLSDAILLGANLTNAKLRGAHLDDADLTNANLTGANLSGADLRGIDLIQTQLDEACGDANIKLPEGLKPPKPCH